VDWYHWTGEYRLFFIGCLLFVVGCFFNGCFVVCCLLSMYSLIFSSSFLKKPSNSLSLAKKKEVPKPKSTTSTFPQPTMPRQNMPQMNIYKQPMMPGGMNGGMGGMGGMSNNNNFQQPQNQYGGMPQQQYRNMPQQPQYGFVPQQNNMGMNNNNFQQGGFQQQQQQQQPQQNSNTNAGFF